MRRSERSKLYTPGDIRDLTLGLSAAFFQRTFTGRTSYESVLWSDLARDLGDRFDRDAEKILSEPALTNLEVATRRLLKEISPVDPFRRVWASDSVLAKCCYLTCRLVKPHTAIETGVAYGVSSAFLLAAMEENGFGMLHSIDLPPPARDAKKFRGIAVPDSLRHRWTLHSGSSRRLLPPLLDSLGGGIDLFVHDSLHTAPNMRREFSSVWTHLSGGGIMLADDVERNGVFGELLRRHPKLWRVVSDTETTPFHGPESPVTFGLLIK